MYNNEMYFPYTVVVGAWWVGVLTFLLCLGTHIGVWRTAIVVKDVQTLFLVFILLPVVTYSAALISLGSGTLAPALVHLILSANYIAVYPALQAVSPTLRMLNLLKTHALNEEEIVFSLSDSSLLGNRVQDLVASGFLRIEKGKALVTKKGRLLARVFQTYRRFMGLPPGDG
jgi:hypothetical protein